jgi:chromate transporter
MERELVSERRWLTAEQMREAIAVCQSLPGPLAIQVGIFISYLRGGFWGAWAGGWAFIAPNFLIVTAVAALYAHLGGLRLVTAIFYGVSPAVIALAATIGIFLPSFVLVLAAAPLLARYRANPNVQGFVKGAYAAAIGTILGACLLLGKVAIGDWITVLVGLASLGALFRWKVNNPLLIATAAAIGLIAFPLMHPTWVLIK